MDYSYLGSFMNPVGTPTGLMRGLQFMPPSYGLPLGGTTNASLAAATRPFTPAPSFGSSAQQPSFGDRLSAMGWQQEDPSNGLVAYHPIQSNARAILQNYLGQL